MIVLTAVASGLTAAAAGVAMALPCRADTGVAGAPLPASGGQLAPADRPFPGAAGGRR